LNAIAPAAPVEEGWITLIVHDSQHVELLGQAALGIQLGISRTAPLVMAGLALLKPGLTNHLGIPIQPLEAEADSGSGLECTPFIHQLMAVQINLPLQIDRAGIDLGNGFKQGDRDAASALEDLPGHRTPALALRQGTFMNHQVVAMQSQLLGAEQTAAAQQQTHIARCQLCRVVNPAHNMSPQPQRLNQLRQVAIEPASAIAEDRDAAGRQRQRFTPETGGAIGKTGS